MFISIGGETITKRRRLVFAGSSGACRDLYRFLGRLINVPVALACQQSYTNPHESQG